MKIFQFLCIVFLLLAIILYVSSIDSFNISTGKIQHIESGLWFSGAFLIIGIVTGLLSILFGEHDKEK